MPMIEKVLPPSSLAFFIPIIPKTKDKAPNTKNAIQTIPEMILKAELPRLTPNINNIKSKSMYIPIGTKAETKPQNANLFFIVSLLCPPSLCHLHNIQVF